MSGSIRLDSREVKRALDRLARERAPRATAEALNKTAFDVREALGKESGRSFDFATPGTRTFLGSERAFAFDPAKPGRLTVRIRARKRAGEVLSKQVFGATLRPESGRFAIPIPGAVRRTARGVPKGKRPKRLLAEGRAYVAGRAIVSNPRRGAGKVLYALARTVRIRPRFDFFGTVARTARREFPRKAARALEKQRK